MSAGWVAGSVRAKSLARRRLGADTARQVAACGSLPDAQQALDATAYGRRLRPGQDLAAAQHEIAGGQLFLHRTVGHQSFLLHMPYSSAA